jgi:hypothetical protein
MRNRRILQAGVKYLRSKTGAIPKRSSSLESSPIKRVIGEEPF